MAAEILKQEKNMRALEYQYKRNMEEEQEEFSQDLTNLQADVGMSKLRIFSRQFVNLTIGFLLAKLKDLTKLSDAAKNAETVRRIRYLRFG